MMSEEKSLSGNFSKQLVRQVKKGEDLLQKLTDAGFELEAGTHQLREQITYLNDIKKESYKGLSHRIELEEKQLLRAVVLETERWLDIMIENQPDVVLQAALISLGEYYCSQKEEGGSWSSPSWVGVYYGDNKLFSGEIHKTSLSTRLYDGLHDCLGFFPDRTVETVSLISKAHEILFSELRYYSHPRRIERFFREHLYNLNSINFEKSFLSKVAKIENISRIIDGSGDDLQDLMFLVKFSYYYFNNAPYESKRLIAILEGFQKIVAMDHRFFIKYEKVQTLNVAASEACNLPDLKGRLKIAEAIDKETTFEYSNLSKRKAVFNKIDKRYTTRTSVNETKSSVGTFTLSEDERNTLDQLCERQKIRKIEAINQGIGYAYKVRRRKKDLEKNASLLFGRSNIKKVCVRISPKARQQLNEVTSVLNGLKATKGKSVSKSAALGCALKIYAAGLDLDPLGYTGKPISSSSQIAEKAIKRRQNEHPDDREVAVKACGSKETPEELEGSSENTENQSASAETVLDDHLEAQPINHVDPTSWGGDELTEDEYSHINLGGKKVRVKRRKRRQAVLKDKPS